MRKLGRGIPFIALLPLAILLVAGTSWSAPPPTSGPGDRALTVAGPGGSAAGEPRLVFFDGFDGRNTSRWSLPAGWSAAREGDNAYLAAPAAGRAELINNPVYSAYALTVDLRLHSGAGRLWFRRSFDGDGYRLDVDAAGIDLYRLVDEEQTWLGGSADPVEAGVWHSVQISGTLDHLQVRVDGAPQIDTADPAPWYAGGIALEAAGDPVAVDFDSVQLHLLTPPGPAWEQSNGPYGGYLATIEIDPSDPQVLYAAGAGGAVFKSTDAGATWGALAQIVPFRYTFSGLLLAPGDPDTIYALADGEVLYKSADAGASWSRLAAGSGLKSAAISPEDPGVLLAGGYDGHVTLTQDGGATWDDITGGLPPGDAINAVAISAGGRLWAGTFNLAGGGLYTTTIPGGPWVPVDAGGAPARVVRGIFVDPADPQTLYVGFSDPYEGPIDPGEHALFVTADGGATWDPVDLPVEGGGPRILARDGDGALYLSLLSRLYRSPDGGLTWDWLETEQWIVDPIDLTVDPGDSQTLYLPRRSAGLLKSTDGGADWFEIDEGLVAVNTIHLAAPAQAGSPVIYTDGYKSEDLGSSWEYYTENGLGPSFYDEIVVSPQDPQDVWVVMDVGTVFTTTDGAATWTKVIDPLPEGRGFRFGSVYALAAAPSDSDVLYAVRNGMGPFSSTDGGENWDFRYRSEVDYTYSLAVDPADPNVVYSGYTPKPFQDWAMVRKTEDGGPTWTTVLSVPHSAGITSVVIDPNDPDRLYAGSTGLAASGGGAIYTSPDAGASWAPLNPHFTMLTVWGQPQLILDPADPATALAATWLGGTWKTADAGASWTLLDAAPVSSTALSADPADPDHLYAADRTHPWLWASRDGGASWAVVADWSGEGAFLVNRVLAGPAGSVYASTFGPGIHGGKLYRSPDGGATWADITGSLPRSVLDIALDPADPQVIYVTTHIHGAYRSDDGGASWSELAAFPDIGGYDIEVDPADPDLLYAAGMGDTTVPGWVLPGGYTFADSSGVYRSPDGGLTWTQLLTTSNECRAIRLHPDDHTLLFAAALDDGLQVSTDAGATWQPYNSGLDSLNLTSVAVAGDKIYAGTQGFGVYGGDLDPATGAVTWQPARSNKPVPSVHSLRLAVDPSDSSRIYAGANPGGLFRSDDGGLTWYDKNFLTPSVVVDDPVRQGYYTFALDPADPQQVWLGTYGKGIFKSYDGMDYDIGANGADQVMLGKHINAILIHPSYGVLAATEEGVYQTLDEGATWQDVSAGLDTPQVRSLAVTANGRVLAGTAGYELYSRQPDGTEWTQLNAFGDWGKIWSIWDDRPNYQYTALLIDPADLQTMYFGTFPAGMFKTTDGGALWLETNVGWTFDGVFSMRFRPGDMDTIYVGTYNGVNRSTDAAAHWSKWDQGWPAEQWVFSIDFDPRDPDVMVACSKNGENEGRGRDGFHGTVMKSVDGGEHWFPITTGLNLNQEFYEILYDRFQPDTLYLATQYEGVFVSRDGGALWLPFNEGLSNLYAATNGNNVSSPMVLSAGGSLLDFGSAGSGVFRRQVRTEWDLYLPVVIR
jgi:photosystem II stability/assembly factor-like uncharacterized protein